MDGIIKAFILVLSIVLQTEAYAGWKSLVCGLKDLVGVGDSTKKTSDKTGTGPKDAKDDHVPYPTGMPWVRPTPQIYNTLALGPEEIAAGKSTLKQDVLETTLFILPDNDGESHRAVDILTAAGAPHVKVSHQGWGAKLEREWLTRPPQGVKRIVTFEIPSPEMEERIRKAGYEVIAIDHHTYKEYNRSHPQSSLEQLTDLIGWKMNDVDRAIATNDRSYIPGMKRLGLNDQQIGMIRKYDLVAQGRSEGEVERQVKEARDRIPKIPKTPSGVFLLEDERGDTTVLKQELARSSPDGIANTLIIKSGGISFSGKPEIVQKLLALDFEALGYPKNGYEKWGGGDPSGSRFFGLKLLTRPDGEKSVMPQKVIDSITAQIDPAYKYEVPSNDFFGGFTGGIFGNK